MRVSVMKCIRDCKCQECGSKLERDIDYRVAIILKSKDLHVCKNCFYELKKNIGQTWIQMP